MRQCRLREKPAGRKAAVFGNVVMRGEPDPGSRSRRLLPARGVSGVVAGEGRAVKVCATTTVLLVTEALELVRLIRHDRVVASGIRRL